MVAEVLDAISFARILVFLHLPFNEVSFARNHDKYNRLDQALLIASKSCQSFLQGFIA